MNLIFLFTDQELEKLKNGEKIEMQVQDPSRYNNLRSVIFMHKETWKKEKEANT